MVSDKVDPLIIHPTEQRHLPPIVKEDTKERSAGKSKSKVLPLILVAIIYVAGSQLMIGHYHVSKYLHFPADESSDGNSVKAQLRIFREARSSNRKEVKQTPNATTLLVQEEENHPFAPKNPMLAVLENAGISITPEIVQQMPPFSDVTKMYGSKPIILGLEKCEEFRQQVKASDRNLAIAGMFNTGTNVLERLLSTNCKNPAREKSKQQRDIGGILWQVAWGKHSPASFRLVHKNEWSKNLNELHALPVVVTKDPFTWMDSLCRHSYSAIWKYSNEHCPNLVPNKVDSILGFVQDEEHEKELKQNGIPVVIHYATPRKETYSNLAGAWNKWYEDYIDVDYPRLIIRFEDLLIHPKAVVTEACHCFGGELIDKAHFKIHVQSAKEGDTHQGSNGFIDALLQYSNASRRVESFTKDDLVFANKYLNKTLMELFRYAAGPVPSL